MIDLLGVPWNHLVTCDVRLYIYVLYLLGIPLNVVIRDIHPRSLTFAFFTRNLTPSSCYYRFYSLRIRSASSSFLSMRKIACYVVYECIEPILYAFWQLSCRADSTRITLSFSSLL